MNERIDCLLKRLEPIVGEMIRDEKLIQDYFAFRDLFGLLGLWFALCDFKRKKHHVSDENMAKYEQLTDWFIELCCGKIEELKQEVSE
jgi:hypothetical protein